MPRQLVGPRLGVAGTDRRVAAPLSSHQGPPTVPARTRLLSLGADKGGHLPAGSGLRLWRTERQRTGHSGGDTDRGFCSAFIRSCLFAAGELGALETRHPPCWDGPGDPCPCSRRCTPRDSRPEALAQQEDTRQVSITYTSCAHVTRKAPSLAHTRSRGLDLGRHAGVGEASRKRGRRPLGPPAASGQQLTGNPGLRLWPRELNPP